MHHDSWLMPALLPVQTIAVVGRDYQGCWFLCEHHQFCFVFAPTLYSTLELILQIHLKNKRGLDDKKQGQ